MQEPYCLISDVHLHNWSAFSETNGDGINSRLRLTLDEIQRAATVLLEHGGQLMVCAGDLFHVRGHLSPSVLNPVMEVFAGLSRQNIKVVSISGNHDLESRDASAIHSSITTLESVGVHAINKAMLWSGYGVDLAFIPWFTSPEQIMAEALRLKDAIELTNGQRKEPVLLPTGEYDLIIHAPLDGVLPWLPNHGLTPEKLAGLGFRRVFCGHYHNHKVFTEGVFSIGALNHQTWNDVGSTAGFLIVMPDRVVHYPTSCPQFVDIRTEGEPLETYIPLAGDTVKGNYVRLRATLSPEQVKAARESFAEAGALGVSVQPIKEQQEARNGSAITTGATLEQSIAEFIKYQAYEHPEDLTKLCLEVLNATT